MFPNYKAILIISVALVQLFVGVAESYNVTTTVDAMKFLNRFGYMDDEDMRPNMGMSKDVAPMLKKYQKMCGLNTTGRLDTATMEMMNVPRCGNPDMLTPQHRHHHNHNLLHSDHTRRKRYALFPNRERWEKQTITYKISMITPRVRQLVSENEILEEIQAAFNIFMAVINLNFVHQPHAQKVDIDLAFTARYHRQDSRAFDGPGNVLAHAFPPGDFDTSGMVHFDESEDWTVKSHRGKNILYVAAHEIGHALGLHHSDVRGSIMAPSYAGYRPFLALHPDDIEGLQNLYGRREILQLPFAPSPRTTPTTSTTELTTTSTPRAITRSAATYKPVHSPTTERNGATTQKTTRSLCDNGKLDAIATLSDGNTYAFQGSYVFQLENAGGVKSGWPQHIQAVFDGLEPNIDAVFMMSNKKSYFFKGDNYWRATGKKVDIGYPKKISDHFRGIPNNIDSAFVDGGYIYFTKGDKYWRFDVKANPSVSSNYPLPLSDWGVESGKQIDASFSSTTQNAIYIFRDEQYWRLDKNPIRIAEGEIVYPRSSKLMVFACHTHAYHNRHHRPHVHNRRDSLLYQKYKDRVYFH